jgi:hypothetical protein
MCVAAAQGPSAVVEGEGLTVHPGLIDGLSTWGTAVRKVHGKVSRPMWGGQSCPQPAFRPAGPAGKRVRRLKSLPHSDVSYTTIFGWMTATPMAFMQSVSRVNIASSV